VSQAILVRRKNEGEGKTLPTLIDEKSRKKGVRAVMIRKSNGIRKAKSSRPAKTVKEMSSQRLKKEIRSLKANLKRKHQLLG
jgi:hypothetical protein